MRFRYPVGDDSTYNIPPGTRIQKIIIDILQTSHKDHRLMVLLISPSKRVYYSARLDQTNNYTAEPDFFIGGDKDFQLVVVSHPDTQGFLGHLLIDLS